MTTTLRRTASAEEIKNRLTGSAVRRFLPAILAFTVLAAAAGWFFASSSDPTYTARGVVELTDDLSGTAQRQVAFEDLEAQRQILLSNDMRALLNAEIGTAAQQITSVAASTDEDSTLLTINVEASNAAVAVAATNALIDLYEERRVVDQRSDFISQRDDAMAQVIEQGDEVERLTAALDAATTESEYRAFDLRQQNAIAHLQNLEAQLQEIDSEVALADGRINVIDRPVDAQVSQKNAIQFAAGSAVLALILSVGLVTTVAGRNSTLQVVDALDGIAPGINVLATVPKFRKEFRDRKNSIVIGREDAMREAEAFRFVRTAIELATEGRETYSVAITSSAPGEGKTVTSANLAVSLASSGSKTLLIDGDLISPSLPELSGRPKATNALPHLLDGSPVDELVTSIGEGDRALHLLINEVLTPLEGGRIELSPGKMRQIFKDLTDHYQTVIIDSPPALVVSDAVATAAAADFTIVVVRLGQARRRNLIRTIEQLRQADANVLGIIATHATGKGNGYSGYGYGDYGQEKRGEKK